MTELNNLAREIARQVEAYTSEVAAKVEEAKKDVAQDLLQDIKADSPKKSGDYKKGWRVKRTGNKLIIYNKTDYQLTHLLEHGHAKIGGGRVHGNPHIAPNEEIAIREYLAKIERAIRP